MISLKGKKIAVVGHVDMNTTTLNKSIIDILKEEDKLIIADTIDQFEELTRFNLKEVREQLRMIHPYNLDQDQDQEPRQRELRIEIINNIHAEYRLIKEKKSTLSRWERDKVVSLIEAR